MESKGLQRGVERKLPRGGGGYLCAANSSALLDHFLRCPSIWPFAVVVIAGDLFANAAMPMGDAFPCCWCYTNSKSLFTWGLGASNIAADVKLGPTGAVFVRT